MDLWVRTQDKRRIIKVFDVNITGNQHNYITANFKKHYSGCDYVDLGKYDSISRALEILDEIHQRLINIQCIEISGADYISNQMKKNGIECVYQMPSE